MRSQMSKSEMELRARFDFSKAVQGKFYERYKRGHTVTLLEGEPDMDDEDADNEDNGDDDTKPPFDL